MIFKILFIFLYFWEFCMCNYDMIIPKFELISTDKSILISIPDYNPTNVTVFAFHGKINKKLDRYIPGDYYGITTKSIKSRQYSLKLLNKFQPNDILYYWLYIQHNNDKFYTFDQRIQIKNIYEKSVKDKECQHSITTVNNEYVDCTNQLIFEESFNTFNSNIWEKEIKFYGADGEFVLYEDLDYNLYIKTGFLHIHPSLTNECERPEYANFNQKDIDLGARCTEKTDIIHSCVSLHNNFGSNLPPIISSKIRTKKSFSFRYGRIEVKAKLPIGDWIYPQIFLEPVDNKYSDEYLSGQIRVAFMRGNEILQSTSTKNLNYDGSHLYGGPVITVEQEKQEKIYLKYKFKEHLSKDFHVYKLVWSDKFIFTYLDDKYFGKIPNRFSALLNATHSRQIMNQLEVNGDTEPFTKEFYISLGVGVGGILSFPDNVKTKGGKLKPWSNNYAKPMETFWEDKQNWYSTWNEYSCMIVDYVRVWSI